MYTIGYNSHGFDDEFIYERAKQYKLLDKFDLKDNSLKLGKKMFKSVQKGSRDLKFLQGFGFKSMDLRYIIEDVRPNYDGYSLRNVCKHLLPKEYSKLDLQISTMKSLFGKYYSKFYYAILKLKVYIYIYTFRERKV